MMFGERNIHYDDADIDNIVEMFSLAGWKCIREGDVLVCTTKGHPSKRKTMRIYIEKGADIDAKRICNGRTYLCADRRVKNRLIQKAAEHSKNKSKDVTIFVATVKDFEEKGGFERIEFIV